MSWIRDALFLVGLGGFAAGLYLHDPRMALVGVGSVLMIAAALSALRS